MSKNLEVLYMMEKIRGKNGAIKELQIETAGSQARCI